MISVRLPALLASALLWLAPAPGHAASAGGPGAKAAAPEVVLFADGLELVVYPQAGARRAALWMVVRAGAANDPPGKAGLAHLVEHLAFGGSHDVEGRAFFDEARAAGAQVNAHTYSDRITFELEVPADRLDVLGARFLGLVTSPAWQDAKWERERGIIETEAGYHSNEGLLSLVDMAVFPAPRQGGPLSGTNESRASLGAVDVIRFFERHVAPANVTVVLTGAVTAAQGRDLVERAFRLPPARAGEVSPPPVERPTLPVAQKMQAGAVVTMLGYLLDPADRELCPPVAALVELRLTLALQVSSRRASRVSVGCNRLRGSDFLVAFAYASTLEAADLPRSLEAALAALATTPPTGRSARS